MKKFAIEYWPIVGPLKTQITIVTASDADQAEITFYGTKAGDNCAGIESVSQC